VIKNWPNRSDSYAEKTPTIIAYNKDPPSWGGNVRKNDEFQVAHFKLGLQEGARNFYTGSRSKVHSSTTVAALEFLESDWRHPRIPQKTPQEFTAYYLKCILDYVRDEYLPSRYAANFLRNQKISYIITVPAIWTDVAKDLTRKAAVRAGIPNSSLDLITEPEAAALYCATIGGEMDLREGDKFLVCDAGGGTVVCSLRRN
jgi:Hsp70 protein